MTLLAAAVAPFATQKMNISPIAAFGMALTIFTAVSVVRVLALVSVPGCMNNDVFNI